MRFIQFMKQENIKWYSPGLWAGLIMGHFTKTQRKIYCYFASRRDSRQFKDECDLRTIQFLLAGRTLPDNWNNLFLEELAEKYHLSVEQVKKELLKTHRLAK